MIKINNVIKKNTKKLYNATGNPVKTNHNHKRNSIMQQNWIGIPNQYTNLFDEKFHTIVKPIHAANHYLFNFFILFWEHTKRFLRSNGDENMKCTFEIIMLLVPGPFPLPAAAHAAAGGSSINDMSHIFVKTALQNWFVRMYVFYCICKYGLWYYKCCTVGY